MPPPPESFGALPAPLPPGAFSAADLQFTEVEEPQAEPAEVIRVREKPKTVGEGYEKRELRKLTPEERAKRKLQWNLMFVGTYLVFLITLVYILYHFRW